MNRFVTAILLSLLFVSCASSPGVQKSEAKKRPRIYAELVPGLKNDMMVLIRKILGRMDRGSAPTFVCQDIMRLRRYARQMRRFSALETLNYLDGSAINNYCSAAATRFPYSLTYKARERSRIVSLEMKIKRL